MSIEPIKLSESNQFNCQSFATWRWHDAERRHREGVRKGVRKGVCIGVDHHEFVLL